ncbi:hypothetical protein PRIPAC_95257 [Pristionchus pacificus]|uniref:Uncharacterized protein n=1 Tax=Pristionchus pacificus TaxID=54126 RepID=A0A2A6BCM6_PRIPA|nr:hypothetical protein PRIPAC_95257 [Pristionchus pacificus]|eukprot:PDM63627.1 hypothetical protein PRIPAC_49600 [Pristionchus pacificus]
MDVSDLVYFGVFCFVFFLGACSVFICLSAIIDDLCDRVAKWRSLNNTSEMGGDAVPILPSESTDTS